MDPVRLALVVDDNAANRALAAATFEDEGYRVVLAEDGEEAIAMVERDRPDCILMDVRMPRLDGVAACERIRQMPGGDGIAIIFLTAEREVTTFDRAVAAGADDFLTKPFRPDDLVLRVQTAMRMRQLAAERRDLALELRHQRERLQRLELQREQLVAFLVHDLKNPVNAIGLHAFSLMRHAEDAARVRVAGARIKDSTATLLRMITNLLDLGKADEERLTANVQAIDARALVAGVIDELTTSATAAAVRLVHRSIEATIHADPDLLARVVANLVENAIRHAPEDTEVRVDVSRDAGGVVVSVADAGPGVPLHLREAVFDRFHSGGASAERTNRGLGLAFCKVAVAAHGGRIWIDDASPGAVFRLWLPDPQPHS